MSDVKHAGDCTIYMLSNRGRPEAGICTCGYGLSLVRKDNWAQMYSAELRALLNSQTHQLAQTQVQPKRHFAGPWSFIRLGFIIFVLPVMLAASIVNSWLWLALPVCALAWGLAVWWLVVLCPVSDSPFWRALSASWRGAGRNPGES
jgi:hypothetical protein